MKVSAIKAIVSEFNPVTFTVTIESQAELVDLLGRLNFSHNDAMDKVPFCYRGLSRARGNINPFYRLVEEELIATLPKSKF